MNLVALLVGLGLGVAAAAVLAWLLPRVAAGRGIRDIERYLAADAAAA